MSSYAPFVGFGDVTRLDDPDAFARFNVEIQGNEDVYPDWADGGRRGSIRQIAGTDDIDLYFGGIGPARLTLKTSFSCREDYDRLRAFYRAGESATLVLLAGFTSHNGSVVTMLGRDYEQYTKTVIEAISDPMGRIGHGYECRVTFLRTEIA